MTLTLEMIQRLEYYRTNPVGYFQDCLGREPWIKQDEILNSVVEYPETYVHSANGIGKTDVAAGAVPWWLTTRRGIVITTANTWKQVETVLWERIKLMCKESRVPLGLRPVGTKINVAENWFAIGLSTNEPDRFQGYHDAEVLVIVEEAGGMNMESLWDALEGCLTGANDRLLAIGNPTSRASVFYRRCSSPDCDRNVIQVSAFDTPNLKEGRTVIKGMITTERVERWRRQWGEDDPRWQSRVLGVFPTEGDATMFPLSWMEAAFEYEGESLETGFREAGLDVARFGPDNSALGLRDGDKLLGMRQWGGVDTMKTTNRLVRCLLDGSLHTPEEEGSDTAQPFGPPVRAKVDADGLGSGVFDRAAELVAVREDLRHVELIEFRASHGTSDPQNFYDFKTEAYWRFREKLRTRSMDLSALSREQKETVLGQATAVTYEAMSNGSIKVVEKRETKKKASTKGKLDELECLIITFFDLEAEDVDNEDYATNVSPYSDKESETSRPVVGVGATWREEELSDDDYLYANLDWM